MRVLTTAAECQKGELERNLAAHLELLDEARRLDCALVVLPEMSLTGYIDPIAHPEQVIELDDPSVVAIVAATATTGVACCFGLTERGPQGRTFITQVLAVDGASAAVQRKRHLGEDEEAFTASEGCQVAKVGDHVFGMTICAEGGVAYPFDDAVALGADTILFCTAPGLYERRTDEQGWRDGFEWARDSLQADARAHAARLGVPIVLSTQAGVTIDEDFPGGAGLIAPDGSIADELPDWRPGCLVVEVPDGGTEPT